MVTTDAVAVVSVVAAVVTTDAVAVVAAVVSTDAVVSVVAAVVATDAVVVVVSTDAVAAVAVVVVTAGCTVVALVAIVVTTTTTTTAAAATIVIFVAQQPPVCESLFIFRPSRSHTQLDTLHSAGLRTNDQPVAETSTLEHTAFTRNRLPCPRQDSNPRSQQASDGRPTP